jgi:hypothetical protein
MFNPELSNNQVNYKMIHAIIKNLTCIIIFFGIYATCKLLSIVIETIFWNIKNFEYKSLNISIMVSVLVTAFIIFISFKGLADELNKIFIKLNNSIIEKNEKIKELEKKLLTNNIKMSYLEDENINNLTNFVVNLNIEDNGNRCKLKKRV